MTPYGGARALNSMVSSVNLPMNKEMASQDIVSSASATSAGEENAVARRSDARSPIMANETTAIAS
jgi:hypothetical protein